MPLDFGNRGPVQVREASDLTGLYASQVGIQAPSSATLAESKALVKSHFKIYWDFAPRLFFVRLAWNESMKRPASFFAGLRRTG